MTNQTDFVFDFQSGNTSLKNGSDLPDSAIFEGRRSDPLATSWEYCIPPAIYAVIFVVGVTGNSLVIYVVAFYKKMRTVTNYYLVNLAVTDLAFLLCCVPFTAVNFLTTSWIFGEVMCKFVNYLMQVTAQATCLTLALLSLDRYCAILHPVASLTFRRRRVAIIGSLLIWIASFILTLPIALYYRLETVSWIIDVTVCRPSFPSEAWERGYRIYTLLFIYFIPLAVCMVTCSAIVYRLCNRFQANAVQIDTQRKKTRKTVCMVIGVVALFAACWLPNHIMNLWWMLATNKKLSYPIYWTKVAALMLSYTNSATNPFVYTIVGEDFRACIKSTFSRSKKDGVAQPKTSLGTRLTFSTTGSRRTPVKLEKLPPAVHYQLLSVVPYMEAVGVPYVEAESMV